MKHLLAVGGVMLTLGLSGCIAIDGDSAVSGVAENTELAVRVCGGESNVAEVTEEGYRCKGPGQ